MHGAAKLQRAEIRRQLAEKARGTEAQIKAHAEQLAALDAGDLADMSDNESGNLADSCSRAPPGWTS